MENNCRLETRELVKVPVARDAAGNYTLNVRGKWIPILAFSPVDGAIYPRQMTIGGITRWDVQAALFGLTELGIVPYPTQLAIGGIDKLESFAFTGRTTVTMASVSVDWFLIMKIDGTKFADQPLVGHNSENWEKRE